MSLPSFEELTALFDNASGGLGEAGRRLKAARPDLDEPARLKMIRDYFNRLWEWQQKHPAPRPRRSG